MTIALKSLKKLLNQLGYNMLLCRTMKRNMFYEFKITSFFFLHKSSKLPAPQQH